MTLPLHRAEEPAPLTIWAVSDGMVGMEAQTVGLAEAVARQRPATILVKHVAWKGLIGRLPWWLNPRPLRELAPGSGIAPPWPDIWIATGRATLPLSIRLRRWSNGRTFVVQTQHPRTSPARFDLVIPPRHDRLEGSNVLSITGSPTRHTPDQLAAEFARLGHRLEPLPRPRVAIVIGGKSKAFDLPPERAAAMAEEIAAAVGRTGGSMLVSFTRRTPEPARRILAERLGSLPGWVWNGQGENPYFAFLAAADVILVTEDSTNLATDAASTGKPVFVLKMAGDSAKFRRFHTDLERRGVTRPFAGAFESWTYEPLAETDRAAAELLRCYDAQRRS